MQFEFNQEEFKKWCQKYGIEDALDCNVESLQLDPIRSDSFRLGKKNPYNQLISSFKDTSILHKLGSAMKLVTGHLDTLTIYRDGEILIQNRPATFRSLKEDLAQLNHLMIASEDCFPSWPHEKFSKISTILSEISIESIHVKGPLASELETEINRFQTLYQAFQNAA